MAITANARTRVRLLRPVLLLFAAIGAAACSHKTAPGAQTSGSTEAPRVDLRKLPGTVFQVTYSENTVAVELATLRKILRGVSEDHNRFLFDGSADEIKQLAPGKILFLKDIGFKQVLAVVPRGSSLVEVDTKSAALFDAISDGEIKWNYPINFESLVAQQGLERPDPAIQLNSRDRREWGGFGLSVAYADEPKSVRLKGTFDEWVYDITATPGLNRIDLNAKLKKQIDSATLLVQATGYISNFETAFDLLQHDRGAYKYFDWTNKNLNGNLSVTWEAIYEGTGPMTKEQKLGFTFPYPLEIPLPIGGIPFSIKFGGAMLFKPGFTGKGELAKGKFQVEYNGVQGIQLKGGNASANGEAHGDDKIIEAPTFTTIGPEGFINGMVFPRIELQIEDDDLLDGVAASIPDPPADSGFLARHATSVLGPASGALRSGVNAAAASASGSFVKDTKSSASAYAEVVVVSSIVAGGAMGLPCKQVQLLLTGKIGAHATLLGTSLLADPYEIELFKHGTTQKNCQ
ncbi:MAG: hypothetical protein ACYDBZ_00035 [Steroidobacteraceae bacterium]